MTIPPQPANAELIERLEARAYQNAVCHCGIALSDHTVFDNHSSVPMLDEDEQLDIDAVAALRSLLDENRRLREALQIQQDESDLQQQGYKLCDNPDHPLFVKWLGPSKPGESGYDRHFQMSALRRAMRIAALARADAVREENP